ncbi:hypothetical protein BO70DRAFT_395256 [Aspergillus heteromorphus CBS 117.55]|uniref:INSIG domain protein n=1 Tax=Aspergillus heteromorphus CBS 117.55 TaxID=1448321 RepID=A0A317WIC9_9EURO|nr:uncharacterized protein BO70DRAFT_395256 [Aspergillus heteromorphus CBS 117.55]PWY86133.1 hypothetical protein BO70DRAFT_395256 [Aspergillus heteromorphus CBS 117.55]
MSDEPTILRPRPRRVFDLTPEEPSTPAEPANPDLLNPKDGSSSTTVSRNASIMNLTSSTLYGIYSPTAFESTRDETSPWGTEAHTPEPGSPRIQPELPAPGKLQRTRTRLSHGLFRGLILPQALKSAFLFGFGLVYGIITIHLHENHWITPVKLENTHYYGSWQYLAFWGVAGVALGNVLPWFDQFSDEVLENSRQAKRSSDEESADRTLSWVAVVRSVGAFVGIAFAMRRLPWESTTQASVTLALVNPVLWYLIDRTRTGFVLSTVVGLAGMGVVLGLKPDLVPSAETSVPAAIVSNFTGKEYGLDIGMTQESIAVHLPYAERYARLGQSTGSR